MLTALSIADPLGVARGPAAGSCYNSRLVRSPFRPRRPRRGDRLVPLAALAVALLATVPAAAAVTPAIQASTFDKVFGFDRALDRSSLQVLIVRHEPAATALAELRQAFLSAGIRAELVAPAAVGGRLGPGVVIYLTPETATPALLAQVAAAKVLSIAGQVALVESGRAGVGLEESGGRTQIVVNLDRVAVEGHDFSAQMLRVARLVRPAGGGAPRAAAEAAESPLDPPVLVELAKPSYPDLARRMRLQGDVVLRLRVDAAGKVTEVELVRGVASNIDKVAIEAARGARFRPASRDGKPVPSVYLLTMPFRL
jgi:TonB family protein